MRPRTNLEIAVIAWLMAWRYELLRQMIRRSVIESGGWFHQHDGGPSVGLYQRVESTFR